jgi:predicted Zn-dependent protease
MTELAACLIETLDERLERRAKKLLLDAIRLEPAAFDGWQKYMLLGQLSEGQASVDAFSRGVSLLRKAHEAAKKRGDSQSADELRAEIACGCSSAAEVYMTDLCMDDDAERQCEALLDMALRVDPSNVDALQCAASFRISQQRPKLARELIMRSYSLWRDIDDIELLPAYHVRVAAAKLMLELREPETAIVVLRRLAIEADDVLEVWHLLCTAHEFLNEAQECALCVSFALDTCATMDADLPERQQFEPFFHQTRLDLANIGVDVPHNAAPPFLDPPQHD